MSIKIMQQVWENAPASGGTLLVLLALADSADDRLRSCFPGIESLAHKARLSERQVKRAIAELVEAGVILVERNASPYKTNLYTVRQVHEWPREDNMSPTTEVSDVTFATGGGDTHVPSDVTPMSPKPLVTSDQPSDLFGSIEPHSDARKVKTEKPDRFDEFWAIYPSKVKKPVAFKAWQKAVRKADPDKIIAAARVYAGTETVQRGFVMHPTTWINSERFNDADLQPPSPSAAPVQRWYAGGLVR